MMYKVGTTQQIVKQLHQEGYQISEYARSEEHTSELQSQR